MATHGGFEDTAAERGVRETRYGPASEGGGRRRTQELAGALGWFSIGLGLAALAAPRLVARTIGLRGAGRSVALLRLVGLREVGAGAGILTQRRPAGWLWARVAGDAMDLALLGSAFASRHARRGRLAATTTAVAGITALDVLSSRQLTAGNGSLVAAARRPVAARKRITINRPAEDLYRFWRDVTNFPTFMEHVRAVHLTGDRRSHWIATGPAGTTIEWDAEVTEERPHERIAWRTLGGAELPHSGSVRFEPAPGGRGTEVTVDIEYAPPGGAITAKIAKVFGQAPEQRLQEDLRRFKQLMETGELIISDAAVRETAPGGETPAPARAAAQGGAR